MSLAVAPHLAPIDYSDGWQIAAEISVGQIGSDTQPVYNQSLYNQANYLDATDPDLWLDVSCYVRSIQTAEGTETLLDVQPPAQATVRLAAGAWQFDTELTVRPGRAMRLRAIDKQG